MARIKGIGGIFFKAENPAQLADWYKKHLDVPVAEHGSAMFHWREHEAPDKEEATVWGPFPIDTDYFDPTNKPYMINYIVEDLDGLLEELRAAGVWIDERREEYAYGRFAWIQDPEGTRIELWEPLRPASGSSGP